MMVTPEQIERLSLQARIDRIEARALLERHDGDLLEAVLELERQGCAPKPAGNGFYSTRAAESAAQRPGTAYAVRAGGPAGRTWRLETFSMEDLTNGIRDLFHRSMVNRLEVWRHNRAAAGIPLLILLLLLVFFFWITAAVLGLGLILGFRYHFSGPDMDREQINRILGRATGALSAGLDKVRAELRRMRRH